MLNKKTAKKIYSLLIKCYRMLKDVDIKIDDMLNNPVKKRREEEPTRYIHIGYPKSASTAIQKGYLGRHNQLLHLGCGNITKKDFWDDHGYIDADINKVVEIDLRYKNSFAYDPTDVKEIFEKYFKRAKEDENIHAVGISNENFSFNWHGGIDIVEKAKRLQHIFGKETKIVVVLRKQQSLIESLYKECIRFGYPGTFSEFSKYIWTYKDRNFAYEFCFDNVISLYEDFFGSQNVKVLFFEDLKSKPDQFLRDFSAAINIDYYSLDFSRRYNPQLDGRELFIKRLLNEKYPHTFGKGRYEAIDNHRFIPYFTDEIGIEVPDEVHIDYETRKHFNKLSKSVRSKIEVPEIELNWESEFGQQLLALYNKSNNKLASKKSDLYSKLESHNYLDQ